jgi:archaellum component FlaC
MSGQDDFQRLVMEQFAKMDQRFDKMDQRFNEIDQRFEKMDKQLIEIKLKQGEHDQRFDNLDKNVDVVAHHAKKLYDTDNELENMYIKRLALVKTDIDNVD